MKTRNFPHRLCKALTGHTLGEIDTLTPAFHEAGTAAEKGRGVLGTGARRVRALGAGRDATLRTSRDKLIFVLCWFKVYPTFDVLGHLFGMDYTAACRWAHRLQPVLEAALRRKKYLPERKAYNLEQALAACPPLAFIVDGTDRPCQRPKHGGARKARYSGRKKRHTIKNVLAVRNGRVVLLGKTRGGRRHDKKCIDEERFQFPAGSTVLGDTGFVGYTRPRVKVVTPVKKGKGANRRKSAFNTRLSGQRICVEHAICGVKRSRICADTLRMRRGPFQDGIMLVACGLHNFRVDSRHAA